MRLASWNINGLRSCLGKGLHDWLVKERIEIACFQEVKTPLALLETMAIEGYTAYWHAAEKPGYSGTAILVAPHIQVLNVTYGMGVPEIDREGRVLTLETPDFYLVNMYAPHSQRELARLGFKLDYCVAANAYLATLQATGKPVIVTGDLNVAHKDIDLANPKANKKNAGFLPEERAWVDQLEGMGFTDAFRHFCKDGGHYTWWSQRIGVREKNVGWRIDYFLADKEILSRVTSCFHQPLQRGSDHCPVILELAS
ncbi:MAG: exodeoxyribonuclease III [Pseudomonas fluorescens]|nr:MAG: exodeoxyribonuclease III [Pseudomonas fluorescens]